MWLWQFNMQIIAAIIEKSIFHPISADIEHSSTNKVSRDQTYVFRVNDHQRTILKLTKYVPGNAMHIPKTQ